MVRHPLTEVMRETRWHNIPMPVREVFLLICQACIGQDIHTWERKCLMNQRFLRLQNLSYKCVEKQKRIKFQVTNRFRKVDDQIQA